jgi:hypothetical protein
MEELGAMERLGAMEDLGAKANDAAGTVRSWQLKVVVCLAVARR